MCLGVAGGEEFVESANRGFYRAIMGRAFSHPVDVAIRQEISMISVPVQRT